MKRVKMKVAELTGAALNWAAAVRNTPEGGYKRWVQDDLDNGILPAGSMYDKDWDLVGRIIEEAEVHLAPGCGSPGFARLGEWDARIDDFGGEPWQAIGPTPQIAVVRCWLMMDGDEVEVPENLVLEGVPA